MSSRKILVYLAWFISAIIYVFIAVFCVTNLVRLIGWFNIDSISIKNADTYLSGYIELFSILGKFGSIVISAVISVLCILLSVLLLITAVLLVHSYIALREIFTYTDIQYNRFRTVFSDGIMNIVVFGILAIVCAIFNPDPVSLLCITYMIGYGIWKAVYARYKW